MTGIAGAGLDSWIHARQIPTCQFWPSRVLGALHTIRKPILLLASRGLLLLRLAERQFLGLLFQEPPRLPAYPFCKNTGVQNSEEPVSLWLRASDSSLFRNTMLSKNCRLKR